jgi:hypothetical protein
VEEKQGVIMALIKTKNTRGIKLLRKSALILTLLFTAGTYAGQASAQSLSLAGNNPYGIKICQGAFALCASSTCTPTGSNITVNVQGGGTASFPEASCLCPVISGAALADVTGGNMQGSCTPPGKGQVWSLYEPKSNLPQQVNNWSRKPAQSAVSFQLCSSSLAVGNTFANCFSFACTINKDSKSTNGVKTATCFCPLGENPDGSAVPADTAVLTPAGQCNTDVCAEHPVGAALVGAGSAASECLSGQNTSGIDLDAETAK